MPTDDDSGGLYEQFPHLRPTVPDWWEMRWLLPPDERWERFEIGTRDDADDPGVWVFPVDELARQATQYGDERSWKEFTENADALLSSVYRLVILGHHLAFYRRNDADGGEEKWRSMNALAVCVSRTLDRMDTPRIDPSPFWRLERAIEADVKSPVSGRPTMRHEYSARFADHGKPHTADLLFEVEVLRDRIFAAIDGSSGPGRKANYDRNQLILDLWKQDLSASEIMAKVNAVGQSKGWRAVGTVARVGQIAREHADLIGDEPPPPRR